MFNLRRDKLLVTLGNLDTSGICCLNLARPNSGIPEALGVSPACLGASVATIALALATSIPQTLTVD